MIEDSGEEEMVVVLTFCDVYPLKTVTSKL